MGKAVYYIGTSGWTYADWRGLFYPPDLPRSRWLEYYGAQFSTVEINATFYGNFKDQTYRAWRARVPASFSYVLKAPRSITHVKDLLDVAPQIETFWNSAANLGEKLGLILLQVAPHTPYDLRRLQAALLAFQEPRKIAVEFRNPLWLTPETFDLLKQLGAVYCSADAPGFTRVDWLTSPTAYIRLHGRRSWYADDYAENELQEIAAFARRFEARGAEKIYIFFNNDYHANAPRNAHRLVEILGKR
jgi:uncharacterized protein YecE (DUF72 family)